MTKPVFTEAEFENLKPQFEAILKRLACEARDEARALAYAKIEVLRDEARAKAERSKDSFDQAKWEALSDALAVL